MKKIISLILIILFVIACSTETETPLDDTGILPEDIVKVVDANNQFGMDLYSVLKNQTDDNIFFSPYSISTALAMTYEGSDGITAEEIQKVFHFPVHTSLRPANARIYNEINKNKKDQLSTANALWAQKDYSFLPEYFDTIDKYYGGKVTNLDFAGDTENSRLTINKWVEDRTKEKIKDLLPEGAIDSSTALVLTNAIYFKGTWILQFDKSRTKETDFFISDKEPIKTQMMTVSGDKSRFKYMENDILQMIELPYEGGDISMIILLPKEDLNHMESELNYENIQLWMEDMEETKIDVYLPKFKFETKYFMAETLAMMGMPSAFSPGTADFSKMTGSKDLYISKVIHQAYVDVNEEGTEAAAATAVIMAKTSAFMKNIFRADHPFIFFIQDKTGNILFFGRVADPRGE
ncbi:MAG: serpin family protein [archaeon]